MRRLWGAEECVLCRGLSAISPELPKIPSDQMRSGLPKAATPPGAFSLIGLHRQQLMKAVSHNALLRRGLSAISPELPRIPSDQMRSSLPRQATPPEAHGLDVISRRPTPPERLASPQGPMGSDTLRQRTSATSRCALVESQSAHKRHCGAQCSTGSFAGLRAGSAGDLSGRADSLTSLRRARLGLAVLQAAVHCLAELAEPDERCSWPRGEGMMLTEGGP